MPIQCSVWLDRTGDDSDYGSFSSSVTDFRSPRFVPAVGTSDHPGRSIFEPLEILTGAGRLPVAEWLSAGGESNLVVSGLDSVGELDPEEVRFLRPLVMD